MAGVKVGANTERRFEYDANGNIVKEYEGDTLRYEYTYDALGQLTGFTNSYQYGYSSGSFTYDDNGNILQKTLDGTTDTYTYGDSSWGDLLTAYNGNAITYDAIGNPLTYYDGSTFTWQNGRQLDSAVVDGKNISFEYNADGMRSAKVVDGVRTEYLYDGAMLLKETQTDADGDLVYTVSFTYDETGRPFSAKYNGNTYYYAYDIYGNVNYVYNEAGTRVVRYTYTDPWNLDMRTQATGTGSAFNTVNPFLYKGYYYDTDLDMYYCGSRYYDWETCRWLNEDAYASTGQGVLGYNMTTYCNNDPVNMIDAMADAPKYITKQTNNTKIDGKKMKDIRFGLGNIANNGCGVIAVYNVLLSKNAKIKFDSVRQGIIACGGTLLLGLAGSSPSGLVAYLQSRFWTVRTAGPITTFWTSKANLSEAIIILIKCKEGINMHYIAGIGTGKKGYFKFYNSGMKDSNSKSIDGRAITISTFLKYALINRVAPLFFIGVSNKMKWW